MITIVIIIAIIITMIVIIMIITIIVIIKVILYNSRLLEQVNLFDKKTCTWKHGHGWH